MRGSREFLLWIILVIVLIACLPMQGGIGGTVKASPGTPTIRVKPRIIEKAPTNSFDVNIEVANIDIGELCNGLYEWSFLLQFNPSILEVTNIVMPEPYFLAQTGWQTAWQMGIKPKWDNENGLVNAGDAIMPDYTGELPEYGAIGSGLLANITFRVKAEGTSLLHFNETTLGTIVYGSTFPIEHEAYDGFFEYPLKVHDIGVTHVTAYPPRVPVGGLVSINATVENEGEVAETFDVTVLYDSTSIETKTVTDLAPGGSETLSFNWDTSDADPGTFIIKAEVPIIPGEKEKDIADNIREFDGEVTILGFPVADFTYSPENPVAGKTVVFNASDSYDPDGTIVSYEWDFGDETPTVTETDPIATHVYAAAGLYTVTLTVTDNDDLTGNYTPFDDLTVFAHDVAVTGVTVSHIAVMPGVPVTINVTVKNEGNFNEKFNVTTYYDYTPIATNTSCWIKPLTFKSTKKLTFTWDTTDVDLGTYTIKAVTSTVTDEINVTNNEFIDGTVTVAPFNKVDYPVEVKGLTFHVVIESNSTVSDLELIEADKKISFNVTGLTGTAGYCNVTIPKKLLRINATHPWLVLLDGVNITDTASIVENATHTFIYFTYTLSTHKVEIIGTTVATPTPPVAVFTPSETTAYVGDSITFDASASYDPDGTIESYAWDFDGDKNIDATGEIAEHAYSSAGNYTVTLTVTDDDGLTSTATTNMTVRWTHDVAVTNLTVFPSTVKVGELVSINVTIANKGDSYETFTVKVYYDSSVVGFLYVNKLAPLTNTTLTTTWDTKDVDAGEYTIKANVTLKDDINLEDNEFVYGTITIEKLSSTISISASPTTMKLGESTTISGYVTPQRAEVTVTIQYKPAGGSWSELPTIITNQASWYSYVWTPITPGTYELKASWEGDPTTSKATSNVITIEVIEIRDTTLDVGGISFHVVTESNSTVSDLELIEADKKISFNVTGLTGTVGFCNVTIPKGLLDAPLDQWVVLVDGEPITALVTDNATHTFIYFTYTLSTRKIEIIGTIIATPTTHDVAVVNVTPYPSKVTVGELVSINVTVVNQGTETENFDITVYYDNVIIETKSVTNLASGVSKTLIINWETADIDPGTYTIKAVASTITEETDTANNELIGNTVTVEEAPALGILLYVAAAAVAAIIIAAMGFYFLKTRKQGVKNLLETEK